MARLNRDVRERLDRMVAQGHQVVVGDASGIDKAVQTHLASRHYRKVVVYCSGDHPRNNVGGWPLRAVAAHGHKRDRRFYSIKDRAMAEHATHGLMVWDGDSVGTLQNVLRMVKKGKPVVLYEVKHHTVSNLKSVHDWHDFRAAVSSHAPWEAERAVDAEASESQFSLS